tara:strand:- start:59 stop:1057 length:999 start_codon:yes stop_codon:yes gene_type:complete
MSRIRANTITNQNANGAPNFPNGITVSGVVTSTTINANVTGNLTVTGNVGVGGTLTYEDVTNIDSVGVITARSGIRIAAGSTVGPISGIITYFGDGSQLTGISVDPSATASSSGFLKVLNASTPQIRLSNNASDNDDQQRSFFAIATGNNNFINGSTANDTVLRGRAGGDLILGIGSTVRMKIDELGRVTTPNNVSFMVKADGNQSYSGGSTFVCNTPNTSGVCHNTGNHFTPSTGVFTAPIAGRYYLSMDVGIGNGSDSATDGWQISVYRNGSASQINELLYGGMANGVEGHVRCDGIFDLSASDTIKWVMNGYNGTMTFTGTKFQGYLLG